MANRRMFNKEIIDSDIFLDMPLSTQALYFHLSMRADDDGFVNNPKKIQRMVGGSEDDSKILLAKQFILSFENGIIVIKHWKMHNYIQKDRYKPTMYLDEKEKLSENENGSYSINSMDTDCIQNVHSGKVSKGKVSLELEKDNIVSKNDEFEELAKNTIKYLNTTAKKNFGFTKGNLKEITSQIKKLKKSGDTVNEIEAKFAYVINVKTQEWINNMDMRKNINPVTLFRESNFDRYLNQDAVVSTESFIDKLCGA